MTARHGEISRPRAGRKRGGSAKHCGGGASRSTRVYASEWCRCRQTAELIGGVPVTPLPTLNSFFGQGSAREGRHTAELRAWLADQRPRGSLILVTHQVNITALTGIFPASGEGVVAKSLPGGEVKVVGRIPPP